MPPSGWQPLPRSEPAAGRHPPLVRGRVGARVALLAHEPEDRPARRREEPARLLDRRRVDPVLGVAEAHARRAAGVDQRVGRGEGRAEHLGAGRRRIAEEPRERLLDDDVLPRPRGLEAEGGVDGVRARRGPRRRPPGRRGSAGRRRPPARRRTPRRRPAPAPAGGPSPSGARRRSPGRAGRPRRGSAPRTPPPPAPRAPAAAHPPSPLLAPVRLDFQTRGQALTLVMSRSRRPGPGGFPCRRHLVGETHQSQGLTPGLEV